MFTNFSWLNICFNFNMYPISNKKRKTYYEWVKSISYIKPYQKKFYESKKVLYHRQQKNNIKEVKYGRIIKTN